MNNKYLIAGVFLLFMILSGLVLSRTGKPFNIILLTIHKLISLGALIYLAVTIYQTNKIVPLTTSVVSISGVTLLLFIALIATGGILSATNTTPTIARWIHRIAPYILTLSIIVNLFVL
jgi:hypothetical protein